MLDNETLYAAVKNNDARLDGKFFVGVRSTGIYCRSVCTARTPKRENCVFFATAAEAEKAGFRPCLLCRPELAPGSAPVDASATLARRAAKYIEENCGEEKTFSALADALGCTDRHLRRAFESEYHVSPVQYRQTCRLLLAKSLLTDTGLSMLEVAMASGFHSLRRFNDVFRKQYRMSPSTLRKQKTSAGCRDGQVTLTLGYRPPYQWEHILAFLAQRAIPGVEKVADGAYFRTVRVDTGEKFLTGWIQVCHLPAKNALSVTVSSSLLPALPQVLSRVRHLFDLYCEPEMVADGLTDMETLDPGLPIPGIRVPGCFDPFEMSVRAVLGQQISVKSATTLTGRVATTFGTKVVTGIDGLTHVFPSAKELLALDGSLVGHLGPLGVIAARSRTIAALAQATVDNSIDFHAPLDPEAEVKKLLTLPGIGPWTAHYIAMRTMRWPDAFLDTDLAIKKALAPRTQKEILALAESWRPWRAYAVMNLWTLPEKKERL